MSLAILAGSVTHVLLADGWHRVSPESFSLAAYEFVEGSEPIHRAGQTHDPTGEPYLGFRFLDQAEGGLIAGPLTSLLAVRTRVWKANDP